MQDLGGIYSPRYLNVIQKIKLVRLDGFALPPLSWGGFRGSCGATHSLSTETSTVQDVACSMVDCLDNHLHAYARSHRPACIITLPSTN